jgi:acetolactate synthase-1/2/3 large subunit
MAGYRPVQNPVTKDIEKALEMIRSAKRPVILAGHGVLQSRAMKELLQFAEKTHTPVALTLLGLGCMPASHNLNLGMMGMHGEAWVNHAIQEADLLLAMGMRFDDRVTGNLKTYAPNARKIHFEIDASEINKNVKIDLALIGDLHENLQQILPHLDQLDHSDWIAQIDEHRGDSSVRDIQNLPDSGHLYAAHVINDLWRATQGKAMVVTDVGQHQMWTAQYYRFDNPDMWLTSGGLGTMGFGLPAGIGAKIAKPENEVWVIAGDGGFQMTMAELTTAAQENVKVNVAIINNGYLGMVRQWQEFFYERRYAATPMRSPDFVKLADAMGLTGLRVTQRSEVIPAVRKAQETEGTVVIDFRVEQEDAVYPMVPAGADLHEMIRRPKPSVLVETSDSF